jgi:hypothetical protein
MLQIELHSELLNDHGFVTHFLGSLGESTVEYVFLNLELLAANRYLMNKKI